jgi:hypothetical protein
MQPRVRAYARTQRSNRIDTQTLSALAKIHIQHILAARERTLKLPRAHGTRKHTHNIRAHARTRTHARTRMEGHRSARTCASDTAADAVSATFGAPLWWSPVSSRPAPPPPPRGRYAHTRTHSRTLLLTAHRLQNYSKTKRVPPQCSPARPLDKWRLQRRRPRPASAERARRAPAARTGGIPLHTHTGGPLHSNAQTRRRGAHTRHAAKCILKPIAHTIRARSARARTCDPAFNMNCGATVACQHHAHGKYYGTRTT